MVKVEDLLHSLTVAEEEDLKKILEESALLTDALSLELIKKVGGPHSPISVNDTPIPNFSRNVTLDRLYQLEKRGIFTSNLEKKGADYIRMFKPTPLAKRIAKVITV